MNRIKQLREQNNLTLRELSSETGISFQLLSNYEHEQRTPRYDNWSKLALFFNVSIDYLKGLTEEQAIGTSNEINQPVSNYYLINNLSRTYLRLSQLDDNSYLNAFEEILYAIDIATKQATYEKDNSSKTKKLHMKLALNDIKTYLTELQKLY